MDLVMDDIKNMEEPEWLEKTVIGDLKLWQIIFICFAGMTTLIVVVCCCFRFRIPRTKQQIEADYQRRKITTKFRQQLETIQDSKLDDMSLKDVVLRTQALEFLHEKKSPVMDSNQSGSQPSSIGSAQDTAPEPEGQKPGPQVSGLNFAKLASKVATISKLSPKSPTSPTPSGTKMDF